MWKTFYSWEKYNTMFIFFQQNDYVFDDVKYRKKIVFIKKQGLQTIDFIEMKEYKRLI